jgi:hypothetical protein
MHHANRSGIVSDGPMLWSPVGTYRASDRRGGSAPPFLAGQTAHNGTLDFQSGSPFDFLSYLQKNAKQGQLTVSVQLTEWVRREHLPGLIELLQSQGK